MNGSVQQIVSAYEDAGMTPELIQQHLFPDIEVSLIKATLAQNSAPYNLAHKQEHKEGLIAPAKPEDITDEEYEQIKMGLKGIALGAEDDNVRFRALKFLFQEKKGRNDVDKNKQLKGGPQINIFQLNTHMLKAREALEKVRGNSKAIDVAQVA